MSEDATNGSGRFAHPIMMGTESPQPMYPAFTNQPTPPSPAHASYVAPPGEYPSLNYPTGYGTTPSPASARDEQDPGAYHAYGVMPPQPGMPPNAYYSVHQSPSLNYAQPPGGYAYPPPPSGYPQLPPIGFHAVVAIPVDRTTADKQEANPANTIVSGRWSVGLCGCCNNCCPNLCMSCWCPCVSLAQIYARMALARYILALVGFFVLVLISLVVQFVPKGQATVDDYELVQDENGNYYYEVKPMLVAIIVPNVVWFIAAVLYCYAVCFARSRVRRRFQIPGNSCCDCMISWCCSCCAIAQMATHVKSYKPGSCDFRGPDVLPAYGT